jgi:hypothetical protein
VIYSHISLPIPPSQPLAQKEKAIGYFKHSPWPPPNCPQNCPKKKSWHGNCFPYTNSRVQSKCRIRFFFSLQFWSWAAESGPLLYSLSLSLFVSMSLSLFVSLSLSQAFCLVVSNLEEIVNNILIPIFLIHNYLEKHGRRKRARHKSTAICHDSWWCTFCF